MNKIEDLRLRAIEVNLRDTFSFIEDIGILNEGAIKSEFPTIDGLKITLEKGHCCFNFSTEEFLDCEEPVKYQHSQYGLAKPFEIVSGNHIFEVKNGYGSINIKGNFTSEGEIWELEENFSEEEEGFFRAVFPMDIFAKTPSQYLLGEPFLVDSELRVSGYINISVEGRDVGLFNYKDDNKHCLFIECSSKISYPIFEKIIEAVVYSYGFISGSLVRDEVTILKFDDDGFRNVIGFQFRKVEDSIISSLELLNPQQQKQYEALQKAIYFPIETFSVLVEKCLNIKPLLRAIKIITQSRNLPVEIEASAIFVALETVKQLIIEENEDKIAPFKDDAFAKSTVARFKELINEIADDNFNDRNSILKKLDYLNKVGNNDSFKLAFELVGFNLTGPDKKCISMRNRFLHGNIPFQNEPEQLGKKELIKVALYAHFLTCSLVLKYVGYSGVVKDFLVYWDLKTGIENDDMLFRPI